MGYKYNCGMCGEFHDHLEMKLFGEYQVCVLCREFERVNFLYHKNKIEWKDISFEEYIDSRITESILLYGRQNRADVLFEG